MRPFLFAAFLLYSISGMAQPGYLGKRISASYGFDFFPMVSQFTPTKEYASASKRDLSSPSEKFITITKGHHLGLSYVVNRKLEILAEGSFRSNDYYMNALTLNDYDQFLPDLFKSTGVETYLEIGVRKYISDFIAPVGLYSQFTFGTCKVQYKDPITSIVGTYLYGNGNRDTIIVVNKPFQFKRLSYAFGVKRMLSDAIFFQGDMNFHLTFPLTAMKDLRSEPDVYPREEYARANLLVNYNSYKWFDLKVAIGILF